MQLADIQRRRSRVALASRPQPLVFPQGLGQVPPAVTAYQGAQMAQLFVYGPLMVMSALGRRTPMWLRTGMLIIGVGTMVYAAYKYIWPEDSAQLGQLNVGPFHKADPTLHRQTLLTSMVAPR